MRTRFNKPALDQDSNTRIVVMELENKIVGFLVDGVSEVLRIPESTVRIRRLLLPALARIYTRHRQAR